MNVIRIGLAYTLTIIKLRFLLMTFSCASRLFSGGFIIRHTELVRLQYVLRIVYQAGIKRKPQIGTRDSLSLDHFPPFMSEQLYHIED